MFSKAPSIPAPRDLEFAPAVGEAVETAVGPADRWSASRGVAWKELPDGSLRADLGPLNSALLTRNFAELPEDFRLRLRLRTPVPSPEMRIEFLHGPRNQKRPGTIRLELGENRMTVSQASLAREATRPKDMIPPVNAEGTWDVEILGRRSGGKVWVRVNNAPPLSWVYGGGGALDTGPHSITLALLAPETSLVFESVDLTRWNGSPPVILPDVFAGLLLRNGDTLAATVAGLSEGHLLVQTADGQTLRVPLAQVARVRLPAPPSAE